MYSYAHTRTYVHTRVCRGKLWLIFPCVVFCQHNMHGLHEALIHIFSPVPLSHPHMYAVVSTSYAMQYKDTFVYIQSADHVL